MTAKKPLMTAEKIAAEIRSNEKDWFVNGLSQTTVKKLLKEKHNCRINRETFAETMMTVGKYYPVLKKKPKSAQKELEDHKWDSLKLVVLALWPEIMGLTLEQGLQLIRTRIRTNTTQLMGLPKRLHYWEVAVPKQ